MGSRFSEFLNRRIFGVKYLYLLAVFVVVLLAFAWKMKSAPGISDEEASAGEESDTGLYDPEGDAQSPTTYPDMDGSGTVYQGGTVYTQPQPASDNTTWTRNAIQWLIESGTAPDLATVAIQKYIAGDQLSFDEGVLRDKAVKHLGLPPEIPASGGTANKPTTPKPPPAQAAKPPLVYTVVPGGPRSFSGVAKKYYGSDADKYVDLIQAKNTNLGHSAPSGGWKDGTKVFVPAKTEPRYYTAKKGHVSASAIAGANGISVAALKELNDTMKFPVAVGRKVRVG